MSLRHRVSSLSGAGACPPCLGQKPLGKLQGCEPLIGLTPPVGSSKSCPGPWCLPLCRFETICGSSRSCPGPWCQLHLLAPHVVRCQVVARDVACAPLVGVTCRRSQVSAILTNVHCARLVGWFLALVSLRWTRAVLRLVCGVAVLFVCLSPSSSGDWILGPSSSGDWTSRRFAGRQSSCVWKH